jgi:cell division protein FtsW
MFSLALGTGFLVALTRKRPRTVMLSQKPPGTAPSAVAGVKQ